ncbi:MAG TPA: thiamine phosphate synthase [Nitrospirota bacterium]|jgi:thiamine-phosphate pyrophosphorylase
MPVSDRKISGLYLISDTTVSRGRGHEDIVRAGVDGGARIVQLREKFLSLRELYPIAQRLREITRDAGALLIVNDYIDLALAVDADGVHLGQDDMPAPAARKIMGGSKIIGISAHTVEEVQAAVADGADYIGFGPIFPTDTKDAGAAKGPDAIRAIRGSVPVPIVAIGGIDQSNATAVIEAGADAVAVISAIALSEDMQAAANAIAGLFRR